jgi:hypothetical protein
LHINDPGEVKSHSEIEHAFAHVYQSGWGSVGIFLYGLNIGHSHSLQKTTEQYLLFINRCKVISCWYCTVLTKQHLWCSPSLCACCTGSLWGRQFACLGMEQTFLYPLLPCDIATDIQPQIMIKWSRHRFRNVLVPQRQQCNHFFLKTALSYPKVQIMLLS